MRIGYVTNAERASGVGERAVNVAQELRRRGWSLDELEIDGRSGEARLAGRVVRQVKPWPGLLGAKSINWMRLGRGAAVDLQAYDLAHLTNQSLSFMAGRLQQPVVVTAHDLIELIEPQSTGAALLARYLYRGLSQAAHVIAVSEYTAAKLRERYGVPAERVTVVYNGVGSEFRPVPREQAMAVRAALELPTEKQIILAVGSDHPRKNMGTALEAFARVAAERDDVVFVKVGAAGARYGRREFWAVAERLGIRERVKVHDAVTQEQLVQLYNEAACLVFSSRHEGFGLPPLQAMACGCPVVASNATSVPEVVGDNGRWGEQVAAVHDPDDAAGMAASVMRILDDAEYVRELREKGRRRAQEFTWERTGAAVEGVYKSLV